MSRPAFRSGRIPAILVALAALVVRAGGPLAARAEEPPLAERYLQGDGIAAGITSLEAHLAAHGDDDQARFGLGALQFLRAFERLGQSLHRHGGLGPESGISRIIPLMRLPVPANPDPVETSYADVRTMVATFVADLAVAEKTLAGIEAAEVSLPLRFGLVRLDLDGDGEATEAEALWRLQAALAWQPPVPDEERRRTAEAFVIRFDRGDAFWLQGYCHVLSAIGEYALAHDMEPCFDVLAPRLFARPAVRQLPEGMFRGVAQQTFFGDLDAVADMIAAIHEMRFEVVEPARTTAVLGHLEAVLRLSRDSWKAIEAETDDDHEWIPNARQACVIPDMRVTGEMIAGWREFLDEAEAILAGRRLVPHWRLAEGRGINVRRVLVEPRTMDFVRWAQGAAAVPYVEQGPCTAPETWRRLERIFGGQFFGFAIWFN